MSEQVFAVDPVEITLADGKLRQLRFTNGSMKRLRKRFSVKTMREVFDLEFTDTVAPLILEGLVDKDGLTEDAIDDLIPNPQMQQIQFTVLAALSGKTVTEIEAAAKDSAETKNEQRSQSETIQ